MPAINQKNLLQIVQTAQLELGLPVDTTVIGSTQQTTQQMYGLANLELDELRQRHNWTALQTEYDLVVSPPTITTGTTALNSAVITGIPSTAGLEANYWQVAGANIPTAARILSVDSATQITMTMEATGVAVGTALTFSKDTYPEPTDFMNFIGDTWWDRTNRWSLLGPDSPQMDQWHRSGIVAFGPRRHFRQLGPLANNYRIWPPPAELVNPLQLVFEYISFNCVYSAATYTRIKYFAANTDVPVLNDRAIIMGLKWRFWQQKGFDWSLFRSDYDNYVDRLIARDGGRSKINMVNDSASILLNSYQVQDGYYPGPGNPMSS